MSGEADLFLTYAHPYVPMLLDPQQFDWIVLGTEAILPVIAPKLRETGAPDPANHDDFLAYVVQNKVSVPYLDYGPASFFGTALRRLFANRQFKRQIVHENSISVGLRQPALRGWGLCWLPETLVKNDLADRHLIPASPDPRWRLNVEIRLCRYRGDEQRHNREVWQIIRSALSPRLAQSHPSGSEPTCKESLCPSRFQGTSLK